MFSFNVIGKTIILIPALSNNIEKSHEKLTELESLFIDIFTLTACAMNMNVIIEYHKQTFNHSPFSILWKDCKDQINIPLYPKLFLQRPLKYFTYGRENLGILIKVRKFAGINLIWGSRFKIFNSNS
jgi:hypothetical protein